MSKEVFGALFGIGGFILVGCYSHPLVALGVFLAIWGHNLEWHDV